MQKRFTRFETVVLVFMCLVLVPTVVRALSVPITGWAWSDTIGWISLSCLNDSSCTNVDYGIEKQADGRLTGYAWSEHIGWISAESAEVTGCPIGLCDPYVSSSGLVTGWLRALSFGGGWDGWISLRDSGFGLEHNVSGLTGWAWGGDVVGWVLFSAEQPCATTAGPFCEGNALKYRDGQCEVTILTSDCGPQGCSSVTNQCVVPSPPRSLLPGGIVLKVFPSIVQYGKRSLVTWNVVNADTCTIQGNGNIWTSMSGSYVTNPINDASTYTLYCVGPGGELRGSARVANPPKVREI